MDALILAVLNALWQGAALIALVALALRAGLRRNATTACVVWSITFLVVALLPALDLALARPHVTTTNQAPAKRSSWTESSPRGSTAAGAAVTVDSAAPVVAAPERAAGTFETVRASLAERVSNGSTRLGGAATAFARVWGFALLGAWALVAGMLLVRLGRAYAAVARMKHDATPLDDPLVLAPLRAAGHRRLATVARSQLVDVPCAVGFRRPMILIPAALAASLDTDDLARIVLHESAHLQRYDDWLNALEQVVCALQFFQPALHVARRGIDFEREVACDDRVLAAAGEPLRYAECLARMVQRRVRGPRVAVAPGFVLRRAQVLGRVHRIVDRSRDASPQLRFAAVTATAIVLAATLGIARLQVPVVAAASAAVAPPVHAGAKHAHGTNAHSAPHAGSSSKHARCILRDDATAPAPQAWPAAAPRPAPAARAARTARAAHAAPAARVGAPEDYAAVAAAVTKAAVEASNFAVATANEATAQAVAAVAPPATTPAARDGGDLLDAIDQAKYPHPSVDDLIALRNQGVSGDYVRRMNALVRPRPTLHDLMSFAVQGVSADYVAGLNRRLAAPPSPDQIAGLRVQGVSIAWLDGLGALGYPKLSADDAVALAVQGVSVAYVRGLLDAGLRNLTPSQIVALRVQGIDGGFVHRVTRGANPPSVDELIRLKVTGF